MPPPSHFMAGRSVRKKTNIMTSKQKEKTLLRQNALFYFSKRLYMENTTKRKVRMRRDAMPVTIQKVMP
jgi:hypothetical protein